MELNSTEIEYLNKRLGNNNDVHNTEIRNMDVDIEMQLPILTDCKDEIDTNQEELKKKYQMKGNTKEYLHNNIKDKKVPIEKISNYDSDSEDSESKQIREKDNNSSVQDLRSSISNSFLQAWFKPDWKQLFCFCCSDDNHSRSSSYTSVPDD